MHTQALVCSTQHCKHTVSQAELHVEGNQTYRVGNRHTNDIEI